MVYAIREDGFVRGIASVLVRFGGLVKDLVFVRDDQLLLEFDFEKNVLPSHASSIDLAIREIPEDNIPALSSFLASLGEESNKQMLQKRTANRFYLLRGPFMRMRSSVPSGIPTTATTIAHWV